MGSFLIKAERIPCKYNKKELSLRKVLKEELQKIIELMDKTTY